MGDEKSDPIQNPLANPANRHFKMQIAYPHSKNVDDAGEAPGIGSLPPFEMPSALEVLAESPAKVMATIERCIYCGTTDFEPGTPGKLTEEHVIPEALGSRLTPRKSELQKLPGSHIQVRRQNPWHPPSNCAPAARDQGKEAQTQRG